jgi:hypothetical protein
MLNSCIHFIVFHITCVNNIITLNTGTGVTLSTRREIDGKYLDVNVKDFQVEIDNWKND